MGDNKIMAHRRKNKSGFTEAAISIPTKLWEDFNALCKDPFTGKPIYGRRSQILTKLLNQYVNEHAAEVEQNKKPFMETLMQELGNKND